MFDVGIRGVVEGFKGVEYWRTSWKGWRMKIASGCCMDLRCKAFLTLNPKPVGIGFRVT